MENKEHTTLLILGKSASGKDTLANRLCNRANLSQLISYTTRPRRTNEGETHKFVSKEDYQAMLANNEVAVDTNIAGNYYWATIKQLYEADVYIIDCVGYKKLKELNLPGLRLVSVFINVPDNIREERALNKRGDDRLIFRKRCIDENTQFREMLKNADFDYAISNIDEAKAYSILRHIADIEGVWKNNKENITE